jgi:hypothetical protein
MRVFMVFLLDDQGEPQSRRVRVVCVSDAGTLTQLMRDVNVGKNCMDIRVGIAYNETVKPRANAAIAAYHCTFRETNPGSFVRLRNLYQLPCGRREQTAGFVGKADAYRISIP